MLKMSVWKHLSGEIMEHELSSYHQKVLNTMLMSHWHSFTHLLVAHLAPLPKSWNPPPDTLNFAWSAVNSPAKTSRSSVSGQTGA